MARHAGVSQPTVSRALRGDPRLSEKTRERVTKVARELGYVPSRRGRSLSTRSTGQVGVVVSDLGNPFYLEILDTAHRALQESDLRMLVLTPDAKDRIALETLVDGGLDGAIMTTTTLDSQLPTELAARGFPFVLLNREVDNCPGDSCVVDNRAGARLVANELLALGHQRIAAIFGPANTSTGRERESAFRGVLADAGVDLPEGRWRRTRFSYRDGHAAALELFASPDQRPTALFCANDIIALGALNALRGAGVRVPREVTLIGFDDVAMASWETFGLTTVRQNITRLVMIATDMLRAQMAAGAQSHRSPQRAVLPAELVRRATHAPAPAA